MDTTLPHNALEQDQIKALGRIHGLLRKEFGFTAIMATEIEFYLHGAELNSYPQAILHDVAKACRDAGIPLEDIQKERGYDQFEIALSPSADVEAVARQTILLREVTRAAAETADVIADFRAKPHHDRPGNGLHIHVHLEDEQGVNRFTRDEEDAYSKPLLFAIAGMLELMPESMPVFAPWPDSYSRFIVKQNAPITLSWGPNNRTVALRLPTKPIDNKHVEHRVAGSDSDIAMVMAAVLAGIHYGLKRERYPVEPTYGDASLPMYGHPHLPKNLGDAVDLMSGSKLLPAYFGEKLFTSYMQRALYPEAF